MQISLAKKLFAVGSAAAMLAALVPSLAAAAPHQAGMNCLSGTTVYYIDASGHKDAYTSAGAFLSYGTNSWSNVVQCSAEDMALPSGNFVTPASGKLYLSTQDGKTVYVITNGQRAGFTNPAALLGLGYSFSKVTPADTSFMTTLAPISTAAMAHPIGTLINDNGTIKLVVAGGVEGIPTVATFNSWGYSFNDVVLANSYDRALPMTGGVMPSAVPGYLDPIALGSGNNNNNPGNPNITPSSGIVVSLASDNPAANTIVSGQSTADLAHFNFSGSGTVTQLTLNRIGVSSNTLLNNVYLYNGNLRITDGSSVNSSGQIVFNNASGLFTSPANISVRADIATGANTQTVGVSVASAMSGSNSVSGTPSGNLFTVANPSDVATAVFQANTVSAASVNAGSLNYTVWSAPLSIAQRSVWLKTAMFKAIGSASTDALQNFILYVDGNQVATTGSLQAINGSNYAIFNPSTAFNLMTGSHTLEVRADIVKGSARNVQFSLQNAADIMLTDSSYNVNITPHTTNTGTVFSTNQAGLLSINAGVVSVQLDPTFSSTTTVPGGATGVPLGKFNLTAYGEDVQINTLVVTFSGTAIGTNGLNNVTLFANGSQVGATQQITGSGTTATFTLGSSLIIPAGNTPTNLVVKADTIDGNNANITSGTLAVSLNASGSNVSNSQGRSSQNVISVPSSSVTGLSLTIGAGGATLSANAGYAAAQTISPNTVGARLGSFVIQAGNNENIRVTNLQVNLTTNGTTALDNTTPTTPPLSDVSDLKVSVNGGTPSAPVPPQASNNFSQTFVIPQNGTATIDVWGSLGSTTSGTIVVKLLPTATGVVSNTSVSFSSTAGQTITIAAGSLNAPTFTTSGSSTSQFVASAGGATDATLNNFNFTASNGSLNISELKFAVLGTASSVASVKIGSVSAPVVNNGTTTNSVAITSTATTLGAAITTTTATTITVASATGITPGTVLVVGSEAMFVTGVSGTTITVVRGYDGTTAATALNGAAVTIHGTAVTVASSTNLPVGTIFAINSEDMLVTAVNSATSITVSRGADGTTAATHLITQTLTPYGTAYLTGLNLAVPNGQGGIFVNAQPTYTSVGTNGISSGSTAQLALTYEKFTAGLTTTAQATAAPVLANTMNLVGSRPVLTVANTNNAGLIVGENHMMDVTVAASSKGNIQVNTIVFTVSPTSSITGESSPRLAIGTTTITGSVCSGTTTVTCTLPSGYFINAGQNQTFSLFETLAASGGLGAAGTSSVTTSLAASSNFSWTDIAGGGSAVTTANTTYFDNYPTQTWSLHN